MNPKFQNKFRTESIRLQGYDYRNEGAYFITICTQDRQQFFGTCRDGRMNLSPIGEIAHGCWDEIPNHFPNASLGAFIIMPDHMHGIISVQTLHATSPQSSLNPQFPLDSQFPFDSPSSLNSSSSLDSQFLPSADSQKISNEFFQEISPKAGSISTMIRSYKSAVSKSSRIINPKFQWQSLFYDHIIRSQPEFDRITHYINQNPANWKKGKNKGG